MAQSINIELKHPFSMLISGVKGVSKAAFTKNLLKYRDEMISPPPRRVIWCYSLYHPELLKRLLSICKTIEYVQGIPTIFDTMVL